LVVLYPKIFGPLGVMAREVPNCVTRVAGVWLVMGIGKILEFFLVTAIFLDRH